MSIPNSRVKSYASLFPSQRSRGPIAVFQGKPREQSDKDVLAFFPGLLRHFLPIDNKVNKSPLSAMCDAQEEEEALFKDRHTSALRPAKKAAIHEVLSKIAIEQKAIAGKWDRKH